MKKTNMIIILTLIISNIYSQTTNVAINNFETTDSLTTITSNVLKLRPVYFNFNRRILRYNDSEKISEIDFLKICRSINDSSIQVQIARYDALTKEKQKLGLIALSGGFGATALLGMTASVAGKGNDMLSGALAFFGVVGIIIIPVCAIASGIPHKIRKEVVFRDLPIAYNQYIELQIQSKSYIP